MSALPSAPAAPPIPTTLPTAARGNISLTVVKMFALQPWCAASASPRIATTVHMLFTYGTAKTGTTQIAQISMVVLRAAFTLQPRLIRCDDIQPPATLPMVDALYTTIIG